MSGTPRRGRATASQSAIRTFAAVLALTLAGCSGGSGGSSNSTTTLVERTTHPVGSSAYLTTAYSSDSFHPVTVRTDQGLVILGGLEAGMQDELGTPFDVLGGGVVVGADGAATSIPTAPAGPLVHLSAVGVGSKVVVTGQTCTKGVIDSTDDAVGCDDGGQFVAYELNPETGSWEVLTIPDGAIDAATATLHAGGDDLLMLEDGRRAWTSTDEDGSWDDAPIPPRGMLCGDDDGINALADGFAPNGDVTTVDPASTEPVSPELRQFDASSRTWSEGPDFTSEVDALVGMTSWSCLRSVGMLGFATAGSPANTSTTVIRYGDDTWSTFVLDGELPGDAVELDRDHVVVTAVNAPTRVLDLTTGTFGEPVQGLQASGGLVIGAIDDRHLLAVESRNGSRAVKVVQVDR